MGSIPGRQVQHIYVSVKAHTRKKHSRVDLFGSIPSLAHTGGYRRSGRLLLQPQSYLGELILFVRLT